MGPFRNHKDKGQCSETADIIQQSSRTELGWAVRIKKKQGMYAGWLSGANRGTTSQAVVPVAAHTQEMHPIVVQQAAT